MATLDTFFAKLRQPSKDITQEGTNTTTCNAVSSLAAESDTRKRTITSQQEEHQQKRSRLGLSNERLKTKKKSRPIVDDSDNEVHESAEQVQISDHELPIKDIKPASGISDTSHRVLREISYEDFLQSNLLSCNRNSEKQSQNNDKCSNVILKKIEETICHKVNEYPGVEETTPHEIETRDADLCSDDHKDGEMVVSPVSVVQSKDIRSFFSKSTPNISNPKDYKICATLVKTKAQIHHDPSSQVPVTLNKHLINNCHSELARWQRANIVITNADLDIEVIEEGNFGKSSVPDQENVTITDFKPKKDETPEQSGASRGDVSVASDTSSVALNSEHEKSQFSADFCVSKEESRAVQEIGDADGSGGIEETGKERRRTRQMKAKKSCVFQPKTDVLSVECYTEKTTSVDSVCERSIDKSEKGIIRNSDLNEEILRQKQELNEEITLSVDLTPLKEKKSVPELSSSPSKLADIFTPRSRRLAEKVQPDASCEDAKSSQDSDARPARRQSSRLCAKAASDAIARSVEALQKTSKVSEKKTYSSSEDESDVEVVCMETQHEKAKSKNKVGNKDTKLAPIFQKRSLTKAKSPVLSAAEIEARRVRREFLISGIPEELKRQQEANLAFAFCPVAAALPTDNHIQQRVSFNQSDLDPWNLPEAELVLRSNSGPVVNPNSTTYGNLLLEGLPSVADKIVRQQFEKHEELSADTKSLLIAEIKSHNHQFPVKRFYNQLAAKRNEVDPPGVKNESKECSSGKKSCAAVVQQVSCKEDLDSDDASDSLLWTDKYAPRCATEIMGNWSSSKKLRDWLTQWKERIARSAEKSTDLKCSRRQKHVTNSVNDESDFSDYSIESYGSDINTDESYLCNAMVLYGPHGVGKTSMAYAIASELGFKIFEVNSSGQRDGRHVLTQLQEATQSHQVSRSTLSANSLDNERLISSKEAEPENVTTGKASKKMKHQLEQNPPSRDRKSNTVERPFASIFAKVNECQNIASNTKKKDRKKPEVSAGKKSEVKLDIQKTADPAKKSNSKNCQRKPTADKTEMKRTGSDDKAVSSADNVKTSLILFEEVDVVLSEDRGFWNAIETFMSITKRPIVLTASDPRFIENFSGRFESIKLHTPQLVNTASFLQTICLVEDVRTSYSDLLSLVSLMHGDVRKALLLLQSWVQTGASGHHRTPAPIYAFADDDKTVLESNSSTVQQSAASKLASTVTSIEIAGHSGRPLSIADGASDEEFTEIRSNKRRRLRHCVDSSDEDSELAIAKPDELILNVDDCSQESCGSLTACGSDAGAIHPPTVALSAELAPHVHRMSKEFIGGYSARQGLMCGGEVFRQPAWVGDCWWPELPTFDTALQSVSFLQPAAQDSQLSPPSVRSASLKLQRDVDEMQSALGELVRKATAKWWLADYESKWDDEIGARRCLRQEVCKYEKLALDVRLAGDFIQSRNLSLQRRALSVDYLPSLRTIAKSEDLRRATNSKRRFYHYMTSVFPDIKESVMNVLCRAFC